MIESNDIIALRVTLNHAANHLDEVRDEISDQYHAGDAAPADVLDRLCPMLNTIEAYAQELRAALIVMAAGGLADDGTGDWYVGDQGPYDTLSEAEKFRDEEDTRFILQQHDAIT